MEAAEVRDLGEVAQGGSSPLEVSADVPVGRVAVSSPPAAVIRLLRQKSGLPDVPAAVAELLGQLVQDVFEYDRVDVLSQEVDEEPVAHVALADDHLDALPLDAAVAEAQHECSDVGAEDDGDAVHQHQEREHTQEQQPEPDEDVDLLVDDVERQDAEGVVLLDVARRAELVECALGHAGEDIDHGVDAILLVSVSKGHDLNAICEEGAVKEPIQQEHLTCRRRTNHVLTHQSYLLQS